MYYMNEISLANESDALGNRNIKLNLGFVFSIRLFPKYYPTAKAL